MSDKKTNGKERPWRERKVQSVNVSHVMKWGDAFETERLCSGFREALDMLAEHKVYMGWLGRKSEKMYSCGNTLEFMKTEDGNLKLFRAWFCKDRLCPLCNWRRSVKLTSQMSKMLAEMMKRGIKGGPIFLTLTMKNVKGPDIGDSFSHYAESFNRLMKYVEVREVCIGAVRSSEITYNSKRKDYNTHIHCLLWMTEGYLHKQYISQARWTELWRRAARLDYTPVVNVKAVKCNPTENDPAGYMKAVLEVTKYSTKPKSVPGIDGIPWGMSDARKRDMGRRISELERGLFQKRLIGFFGIFKTLHKELDLDDVEDGDLIGADEEGEGGAVYERYSFSYDRNDYYRTGHDGKLHKGNGQAWTSYPEDGGGTVAVPEPEMSDAEWAAMQVEKIMGRVGRVRAERERHVSGGGSLQHVPKNGEDRPTKAPGILEMSYEELIGAAAATSEVKGTVE